MYRGLWMFAWDLADEGVDKVLGWSADSGLDAVQVAGSYHAGWFIHPHNPKHRAYMTDDGCVYFHPDLALYADTVLKPKVARACAETDWMREAGQRLDKYGLKLVSWTVCTHNTRMGLLHPDCTVQNCFGDSYPHALCPGNDQVRRYLTALCKDLANNLPMHAVQLESPGYMGLTHGHHHERDLTVLSPMEQNLMSLCFCPGCQQKAQAQGIDSARLQASVRSLLESAMQHAPNRPQGYPSHWAEVEAKLPELAAYQAFRKGIEDSLVHEIRAAMRPSSAQLWTLEAYNPEVADVADAFYAWGYGLRPAQVLERTREAKQPMTARDKLFVGVRLGLNSVFSVEDLTDIVRAIQEGGGDGVMFYNYSESPMTALNWIKPALANAGETR
ncbi:MAG TPA: hypothetical protein VFB21_21180 [Chthonomonadaceae bacterium]|nr:hypothetical protein [Chthonomonadaceae bacterium]